MSIDNWSKNRRDVLKTVCGGIVGSLAFAGTSGAASKSIVEGSDGEMAYQKLRGTVDKPVVPSDIESIQESFSKRTLARNSDPGVLLDPKTTFADDRIVGYNIISAKEGAPKEQFFVRGSSPSSSNPDRPSQVTNAFGKRSDHLQRKADDMLTEAVEEAKNPSESVETSTNNEWDIDWDEWYQKGSTDLYWEPDLQELNGRVGIVEFTHDVRESDVDDRIGASSKIRMEPGRQLCNDGLDRFCTNSIQTGFRNKSATIYHKWDQWINEIDKEDLIVSTDPEGQEEDVSGSRGFDLTLEVARDPSLSIGYSSEVSFNGAQVVDATSKTTGYSEHQFTVHTPQSYSSRNNGVFEVASLAQFNKRCKTEPPLLQRNILEIDVDLEWGLDFHGFWVNTENTTKSFDYQTWC